MQKTNQPQINTEKLVRDASAQISDSYIKAHLIIKAMEERLPEEPRRIAFHLAMIIDDLTSPTKFDREYAKKQVRELMKLGKAE